MIELIVTIFAGLGFCSSVHFVIHLIEKLDRNAKKQVESTDKIYYWYVTYNYNKGNGRILTTTVTKNFKLSDFEDVIRKSISISGTIIINSFVEVSKEFYEMNTEQEK